MRIAWCRALGSALTGALLGGCSNDAAKSEPPSSQAEAGDTARANDAEPDGSSGGGGADSSSADAGGAGDASGEGHPDGAPATLEDPGPAGPFGDPLPATRTATLVRGGFDSLDGPAC